MATKKLPLKLRQNSSRAVPHSPVSLRFSSWSLELRPEHECQQEPPAGSIRMRSDLPAGATLWPVEVIPGWQLQGCANSGLGANEN